MSVAKVKKRLAEPSTYAGLGILASIFDIKELLPFINPQYAIAVAALAAIFLGEKGPDAATMVAPAPTESDD